MTESECLSKMVAPGQRRASKWLSGVIQILVTSSCDKSCTGCTQLSQLRRKPWFMTPEQFEQAVLSLKGYFGVYGVFGGNPALSPHFAEYCEILKKHVPFEQRGIWCNAPLGKGHLMRSTFNPHYSNLNVHLDREAYDEFKKDWPESMPFGLNVDSRHSPCYVAMKDVLKKICPECKGSGQEPYTDPDTGVTEYGSNELCANCPTCEGRGNVYDESTAHDLISKCDINQRWSAGVGVFRGQLRAWFCEIAMAQSIYHQDDPEYPDTGLDPLIRSSHDRYWWDFPMQSFAHQVRKHCHECSVPLRGYGSLAQSEDGVEQVSEIHAAGYLPKRKGRRVELVQVMDQLKSKNLKVTDYLGGASK